MGTFKLYIAMWEKRIWLMLLFPFNFQVNVKTASVRGIFECCVYLRSRLFRMYGNTKKGSDRVLKKCDTSGSVLPLPTDWRTIAKIGASNLI